MHLVTEEVCLQDFLEIMSSLLQISNHVRMCDSSKVYSVPSILYFIETQGSTRFIHVNYSQVKSNVPSDCLR